MAIGKKGFVMIVESWIDAPPSRVVFPVKSYKPPKLETIEEEKEEKCEDEDNGCRRYAFSNSHDCISDSSFGRGR